MYIFLFHSKVLNINGTISLGENSIDSDPMRRPWYMKGGIRRPFPARKVRNTGRRLAQLWPEENVYDDRVTNQVIIAIRKLNFRKISVKFKRIPKDTYENLNGSLKFKHDFFLNVINIFLDAIIYCIIAKYIL